ncbi:MAG: hypothetical protein QGG19_19175 [Alphaproteobacteria bacterium]|nr:hypothetical protein [Alphaproteobacteria bacterium]
MGLAGRDNPEGRITTAIPGASAVGNTFIIQIGPDDRGSIKVGFLSAVVLRRPRLSQGGTDIGVVIWFRVYFDRLGDQFLELIEFE